MIRCPVCHCDHLPVHTTVQEPGKIRRYRKCRHCGEQIITIEYIRTELADAVKPVMEPEAQPEPKAVALPSLLKPAVAAKKRTAGSYPPGFRPPKPVKL